MRALALGSALAGGVFLVGNLFVDADALTWIGLALLAVAVAVVGAGLARAAWLAAVTAVGSVALAAAVLEVGREIAPDRTVEAVAGGLATLCVAVALLRGHRAEPGQGPAPTRPASTRPGNHRS